ncbi:ribosome maturation factor RimM [Erythrobacter sp. LQ02-29]|uniref:ribosome maturation factor RimM n=1 Tax=Erythrobacter sp. LQ02-29 TaxID=2920384 RepID=UPI001F4EC7DD|nr:ribosome maturation factor RimM [Erythrobacter sp. LQ02-29]MCP9222975.1 ribosome maturation factor RimM [Erythrobacter sp. LQ02-29]
MTHPARPPSNPTDGREGNSSDRAVTLAAVTGAHGVTGEVRLKLFGEDGVASLKPHKRFNDGTLTLAKVRDDGKGGAIARFAEIADRNAAEALRGTVLTVPRETLPPLEEGEFYHADLIGLPVVTDAGDPIGTVADVVNYGATDIIEIARPDAKPLLVPLIDAAVPEWNGERLVVTAAFVED